MFKYFAAAGISLLTVGAASAQELLPVDYSAFEEGSIKTIRIDGDGKHKRVVVAIANHSPKPFNANFACSTFDVSGAPWDTIGGAARSVPPHQEVTAKSMSFMGDPSKVVCRIELINTIESN